MTAVLARTPIGARHQCGVARGTAPLVEMLQSDALKDGASSVLSGIVERDHKRTSAQAHKRVSEQARRQGSVSMGDTA
jgi:hypothetical protein